MRDARFAVTGFAGFLAACLLTASIGVAQAQEADKAYDPARVEDFCNTYERIDDPAQIRTIQDALKTGGYDTREPDGKMDDSTVDALKRLCEDSGGDRPFEYLAANPLQATDEEPEDICDVAAIDPLFRTYPREQMRKIQVQLKLGGYDPGQIDGLAGKDTDLALSRLCTVFQVGESLKSDPASSDKPADFLAARLLELLDNPVPVDLGGETCGCSRDFSNTLVYGFYPYLLADKGTQTVDFSLFDRIGFHTLILGKKGQVQSPVQDSDISGLADFIHRAHRYRVKADATFYATGWEEWDSDVIENAARNIAAFAVRKFDGSRMPFWQRMMRWVPGGSSQTLDGINLYFDYGAKTRSSKNINAIVEQVSTRLGELGDETTLNIILGLELGKMPFDQQQFQILKPVLLGEDLRVKEVLIFLPVNTGESRKRTSEAKKLLRQIVENAFHGENRITVLRKIVPVVSPVEADFKPLPTSDVGDSQFDDDLLYFKDNFHGVGLWPLPLESSQHVDAIRNALIRNYQGHDNLHEREYEQSNYLGELLQQYAPGFCEFVCPNRLYFYLGLGSLVSILLIYALLAMWNCRLREIYQRKQLYFLVLILMIPIIFVISLVCDPAAEKYVDTVVIGILLFLVGGYVWQSVRKAVQPKLP